MPLYVASSVSQGVPSTTDFLSRGLTQYTIGSISQIGVLAKPTETQLAYSGYKDNIEVFLAATAAKTKIPTNVPHVPIPVGYTPTFPLPLPRTTFRLKGKPTETGLKKMETALESEGLRSITVGRGDPAYVLDNVSFSTAIRKLPHMANERSAHIEGYSQAKATANIAVVWQCIDLFCCVHTYSYRRQDFVADIHKPNMCGLMTEIRLENTYWREGYPLSTQDGSDFVAPKRSAVGEDYPRAALPSEPVDLHPHLSIVVHPTEPVLVAKPSPKPSKTCWGSPKEVPNQAGLLFPYFPGMLRPDTKYARDIIGRRFFRNLGMLGLDPRQAYKNLRDDLGIAVTTKEGSALCHILLGIDLALNAQAQCFFLFDGKEYLGFTLLGEEFSVFIHGQWHQPLHPQALREELDGIQTHAQALESLFAKMSLCKDSNGDAVVTATTDMDTPVTLANALAQISFDDDSEVEESEITELLKRLRFPVVFKTPKPEHVMWALDELSQPEKLIDPFLNIFIPLSNWAGIDKKEYQVLAAFGPRSISFRNSAGTEYRVPANDGDEDILAPEKDKTPPVGGRLIIYEKPVRQCVSEWVEFKKTGKIRANYTERAVGSRAVVLRGDQKNKVWSKLKELARGKKIGTGQGGETQDRKGKKRAYDEGPGAASSALDLDALF